VPDVVVIGAGSAGAVLAAGLSAQPSRSVLLLEAGPDHRADDAPAAIRGSNFFAAVNEPGRIWPELTAVRAAGQVESLYLRGRGAGGSSSINAMCALRGTPEDYDRWAHDLGCPGWGWPEMLEAFLRVEDDLDYGGDGLHGRGGPVPLARVPVDEQPPLTAALRSAMASRGYPECDDAHAVDATGVGRAPLTRRNGRRVSTNDAYLEPARTQPNLDVRGDTLVDRVVLDGRRAVGVVTVDGEELAAGTVVVSAGAIHSPAILLRSGIGIDDELPVGRNLKDHAATPGFEIALRPEGRARSADAPVFGSLLRYSSGMFDAGPNDMQMLWFDAVGPDVDGLSGGRLIGAVMRVFSSGEVRLRSSDATVDPVVEFRLLSDDRDRARLVDCVHRMIDVVTAEPVARIAASVTALDTPIGDLRSDAAIDAWISRTVNDYVHAVGTCRMGTPGDPAAVVDCECAVIGYEQLLVCDASVMPDIPRANTHLTTVAIADALVDRLLSASSSA